MSEGGPPPNGAPEPAGDDLDRVTEIVIEALERTGEERRAYLERACGQDRELRAEVDSLLAEHDLGEPDFLEVPAPARLGLAEPAGEEGPGGFWERAGARASEAPAALPERIGPYRVVDRLGEGGMATVYLAEQDEPVRRRVAVKIIRALRQPRMRERFAAECQALARLNHPNVAALYEAGAASSDGDEAPYVAMEWVEGDHVTTWCDDRRLDVESRIRLFLGVCGGIQHAHQKGVLHCDLKPSNVLVTEVDGAPLAKVIDFGIARALDEPLAGGEAGITGELFLGSPRYISPEAARRGGRKAIDVRSDVYSLGLILYELLTGVLPLDPGDRSVWQLLEELATHQPPPPSERFGALEPRPAAELAARRGLEPRALVRALRGDLDAIVAKAIAREPAERYGSVGELAADLDRHLRHRPVEARARAPLYLFGRLVRRHLGAAAAALLLLLALSGGLVARTVEARRANAEAERARAALAESELVRELLVGLFESVDPSQADDPASLGEVLDRGAEHTREELADRPLVRARLLHTLGEIQRNLGQLARAESLVAEALALREAELPDDHPEVLANRAELGVLYRHQGRLEEAEPLLKVVLAARRADPDADPLLLADAYNDVGNLHWNAQRYDRAEAAYREALALRERHAAGTDDEAGSANNLGVLLQSRGRYAEARPLLERAAELFREVHGPNHPRVGAALNNLGLVARRLEHWAEAEELFREAVEIWERAYDPGHRMPLMGRRNLIDELRNKHRWDDALAEARAATAAAERHGGSPVALIASLRQQGQCEREAGLPAEALATLRRAVERAEADLGAEHPDTLRTRHTLALSIAESGAIDEGIEILGENAAIQDRLLPADHPSRLRTEMALGVLARDAGRPADSEARLRRVVEARIAALGGDHPSTASALHELGRAVAAQGRDDEAAELLERALAIGDGLYGPDHPSVAATAHELARIEHRRGRVARARELLEQAVAVRRATYPPGDPDLSASLDALAAL